MKFSIFDLGLQRTRMGEARRAKGEAYDWNANVR